jgi:hypothetical protein
MPHGRIADRLLLISVLGLCGITVGLLVLVALLG